MALDSYKKKSDIDFVSDVKSDVFEGSLFSNNSVEVDVHYQMWLKKNGLIHNNTNYKNYLENLRDNIRTYSEEEINDAKRKIEENSKKGRDLIDELTRAIEFSDNLKDDEEIKQDNKLR